MAGLISCCYCLMQYDITVSSASLRLASLRLLSSPGAIVCRAGFRGIYGCGDLCGGQGCHSRTDVCRRDNSCSVRHTAVLCTAATVTEWKLGEDVVYADHLTNCKAVCSQPWLSFVIWVAVSILSRIAAVQDKS